MTVARAESEERGLTRIEADDRVVVLARTMRAQNAVAETAWSDGARNWVRFGATCLGQALYRQSSIFAGTTDAPGWSHVELSYFRDIVPLDVINDLVFQRPPEEAGLLRAEMLLTTPSSFIMPQPWRGLSQGSQRQASLEFIHVLPARLCDYRDVMRRFIGPAAAALVANDTIGTFRAMETVAVLYRSPSLAIDWNQIHLCEVDAGAFTGFGQLFDAAFRSSAPDGSASALARLREIRTIPRWTLNDAVIEAAFV